MIIETKEACRARIAALSTLELHAVYKTTDSRTMQDIVLAELAKRPRIENAPTANEAIEIEYRRRHELVSRAQQTYLDNRTPANWQAYLDADAGFTYFRIRSGQLMMQAQIDRMSPADLAAFHQAND